MADKEDPIMVGLMETRDAIWSAVRAHPDYERLDLVMRLAAKVKGTDQAFTAKGAALDSEATALVAEAEEWWSGELDRIARIVCRLAPA